MDRSVAPLFFMASMLTFLAGGCTSKDTLYVACSPHEVRTLLQEPDMAIYWLSPRFEEVTWDSSTQMLSYVMPLPGGPIPQQFSLQTETDTTHVIWRSGTGSALPMQQIWTIQPEQAGSRVSLTFSLQQDNPLLALPLMRTLREMRQEMLARLKSAAEERCSRETSVPQ